MLMFGTNPARIYTGVGWVGETAPVSLLACFLTTSYQSRLNSDLIISGKLCK